MNYPVITSVNVIENKDKKLNANEFYYVVFLKQVTDLNTTYEPCFLTERELERGVTRAKKNPEDLTQFDQFEIAASLVDKQPKHWFTKWVYKLLG